MSEAINRLYLVHTDSNPLVPKPYPMKSLFTLLFAGSLLFASFKPATAQTLITSEFQGTIQAQFANFALLAFGLSAKNDIDYYTVTYTMDNLSGRQDTVSGLYVTPSAATTNALFPTLIYQHGTTNNKFEVPSAAQPGQDLPYLYATQGYAVLAPDFLNMGEDQEGFHPYLHARTEALAALRMMEAMSAEPAYADVINSQLFLTGYSQGGHASMALHEILIEEFPDIEVTATAHMSGPYSLSDVQLNEVALSTEPFGTPAFLPYVISSFQEVYGDLYNELNDIYKPEFSPGIQEFIDGFETGSKDLSVLNQRLLDGLAARGNDSIVVDLFDDDYIAGLQADPNNTLRVALALNDTYDFVNPTPTRLYYCDGDDQVNPMNSPFAEAAMNALGATDTEAIELGPDLDHGQCVFPAVTASVGFFADFQQIISSTNQIADAYDWTYLQNAEGLRIYTNDYQQEYQVSLVDATGRQIISTNYRNGQLIDLSGIPTTWAAVQVFDEEGRTTSKSIIVR